MSLHESEVILDYSVKDVFSIFAKTAKRDFPGFNEKDPIGATVTKQVGAYSSKTGTMTVEITDYIKNEVYEIRSATSSGSMSYISRYEFTALDENKTKLVLIESEGANGIFSTVNVFMTKYLFKKRIKRRFDYFVKSLENELQALMDRRNGTNRKSANTEVDAEEVVVDKEEINEE
ncbi:DUF3284 domain-containing protein [Clostridium sp. YIM B02551]|uniref:DUF3284 domain-containing protein n=1 Tax=Clostridium sp. YIM B02551 TaxID=2910679 RepID=UPI001EEBB0A3|nr:DUF3284 domain-containing protein [Clostridium sp. YIM B02551]